MCERVRVCVVREDVCSVAFGMCLLLVWRSENMMRIMCAEYVHDQHKLNTMKTGTPQKLDRS